MSLTLFGTDDKVISTDKIVTSTWTNNLNNLQTAQTSSLQAGLGPGEGYATATSSGQFFIEVYQTASTSNAAEVQYAVAYGNRHGSGSPNFTDDTGSLGLNASRVIYSQYQQLIFNDEASFFTFDGHTPDDIYVLNVNRSRYKHNLKPGTLNLHLSGCNLGLNEGGFGTEGLTTIHLTDDSVTNGGVSIQTSLGRQFNIVSGSSGIQSGSILGQIQNSSSYGLFYPDAGIVLLNADNFGGGLRPATNDGLSTNTDRNNIKLKNHISGGLVSDDEGFTTQRFVLDSEEKVTSQYYFIRTKNNEYNYTTNPSFVDTNGVLNFDSMIDNPTVYITTIGLFNNAGDMVAVAKLSQPITKDFTKEALIRVKLDY